MPTSIFINLPVKDLDKSKKFAEALGWKINPQFTDETAASVVISDTIFVMLLTHDKYRQFTDKQIVDATKSSEVILAMSVDSKEAVGRFLDAAIKAGGRESRPAQDHGFMQLRTFEDLDGHHWEIFYMDPSFVQPQ